LIRPVLAVPVLLMVAVSIIPAFADTGVFPVQSGKTFQVSYSANGVKIQDIEADPANDELTVTVLAPQGGSLELMIPRALLDAKQGNSDIPFIALVDGTPVTIKEQTPTTTTRSISIPVNSGSTQIEVIGTYVASPGPNGASIQTVQPPQGPKTQPTQQLPQQLPRTPPQTPAPVVQNPTAAGIQKKNATVQSSLANQTQNLVIRIPYLPNVAIRLSHIDLAVIAAIIILVIIVASVARRRQSKIVWTR